MKKLVDIMDNDGNIIGNCSKKKAYEGCFALKVVGILLFKKDGKIILQRRAKTKKYPYCYDYSAAGHIYTNESLESAAQRKLKEELNLNNIALQYIGKIKIFDLKNSSKLRKIHYVFTGVCDCEKFVYGKEIFDVQEFEVGWVVKAMKLYPNLFNPNFINIYNNLIMKQKI